MASLSTITEHLASFLHPGEIPDYPNAHNGLQLENKSGEVRKVRATGPRNTTDDQADEMDADAGDAGDDM